MLTGRLRATPTAAKALATNLARRLWRAYLGFSYHDGSLVAAGIAYYVALSFFPLMLVLVAGVGVAVQGTEWGQDVRQQIFNAIGQQMSPDLAEQVKLALSSTTRDAWAGGSVGLIALVITAIAIFVQVDYAFDRIWHLGVVRQESWSQWFGRHVLSRLKALGMLVAVGAFLVTALVASVAWSGVQKSLTAHRVEPTLSWLAGIGVNMALNYCVLTVMYKYVPKPYIRWREAFAAGLIAAPLWEAGRQLLSIYLLRLNYPTAYGIIGSFLAIMLWAYYVMLVVLFGAEYVRVRQSERVGEQPLGV
ncbi:MAG TPA: YihY/virulence factor BrkB family protein [Lacipirellulaceae bacterium]|nr:YihY/virulence factor BrkB family protein [Lacipirellulaceae bacterium]